MTIKLRALLETEHNFQLLSFLFNKGPVSEGAKVEFPLHLSREEFQDNIPELLPGLRHSNFQLLKMVGSHSELQELEAATPGEVKTALKGCRSGLYVRPEV